MIEDEIMEDISDWEKQEASDWAKEAAKKIIETSEKIKENKLANGEISVSTDLSADRRFTNG